MRDGIGVRAMVWVACFTLAGCATVPENPRQRRVRADFVACQDQTGARNTEVTSIDALGQKYRWEKTGSAGRGGQPALENLPAGTGLRGYRVN